MPPPDSPTASRPPDADLTALDEVAALIGSPAGETPTTDHTPTRPPSAAAPALGPRYRPEQLYRGGGLGQVWAATDTLVGRPVAVKVVRPDRPGVGGDGDRRLLAEGTAAARLEHPNIVPVYDLLPGADGQPAYVMRLVAGKTLAEAAKAYHAAPAADPRAALAPLLDAFVLVCRAVAFAHSRGVLHRDLKGSNVVLGEFGEVYLLDWGLAKENDAAIPADPDRAASGISGTPAYMAPEVAAGHAASPASDVYGLGATLYAVLTNRPPADGTIPQEVLEHVREHDPPPPRAVNKRVPAALDAVVRKAMTRTPGDRYPSADALAADVRAWLADGPVTAYPDGLLGRVGRWGRRHRGTVVAAGLGLAVVSGVLAAAAVRLAAERRRAEDSYDAAVRLAADVVDRLADRVPGGLFVDIGREQAYTAGVAGFEELARLRPDRPPAALDTAKLHRLAAKLAANRYDFPAAAERLRRATDRSATSPPDWAEAADRACDVAAVLQRLGRLRESEAELATALNALPPDDPSAARRRAEARLLVHRGAVAADRGDPEAEAHAGRAAELFADLAKLPADQQHPYDPLQWAVALTQQANRRREAGDLTAARTAHIRAAQLLAPLRSPASGVQKNDAEHILAVCKLSQARTLLLVPPAADKPGAKTPRQNGLDTLDQVVTAWGQLAKDYPAYPVHREWLGVALVARGEARDASDPAGRADLTEAERLLAGLRTAHPDVAALHAAHGSACRGLGRADPAGTWRAAARASYQAAVSRAPGAPRYAAALAALPPD